LPGLAPRSFAFGELLRPPPSAGSLAFMGGSTPPPGAALSAPRPLRLA